MPKEKTLPSELRRRKLRGTLRKHVEMKFGKVTDDLFGKCIGMQRTAAGVRMKDPGQLMLWQSLGNGRGTAVHPGRSPRNTGEVNPSHYRFTSRLSVRP